MKINDPVYGFVEISEPVIIEILETKPLQRIKKVNQSGTNLVQTYRKVTRYDHCVGDMLLLKKFGASLEEQIAGLLHDVPHTAFSHTVDFVFKENKTQGYHDRFLKKIVFASEIPAILKNHGIDPENIIDETNFPLQERKLPELCADRIDYSLRDMLVDDKTITAKEVKQILDCLTVHNNRFTMTNAGTALFYSRKFMSQCLNSWAAPQTLATFELLARVLRTALEKQVLNEEDLFGNDEEVLSKLKTSQKHEIETGLGLLKPTLEIELNETDFDFHTHGKARYIDPPVLTNGKVQKVSEIFPEFKQEIEDFIKKMEQGYKIKILSE